MAIYAAVRIRMTGTNILGIEPLIYFNNMTGMYDERIPNNPHRQDRMKPYPLK
jgi:hypothetical protein